jgi:hypothetical protein
MQNFFNTLFISVSSPIMATADDHGNHDTDSLYRELIRTVTENDFDSMAATYHQDAVLVTPNSTSLISSVIPRWRTDGDKLKAAGGKVTLAFKFAKRIVNEETAFEQGIFRYATIDAYGKETVMFYHFEDLNRKMAGKWRTMMENKQKPATEEEWNSMPQWQ